MTQAELAALIGFQVSSIGNMESSNRKVIREDRVGKLARIFQLDPDQTAEFLAAWHALPISEYSERQRKTWAERNARRNKARNHDKLKVALIETLGLLVSNFEDPGRLCICEFGGGTANDPTRSCELCSALQCLGMTGWTTLDEVVGKLAELQPE